MDTNVGSTDKLVRIVVGAIAGLLSVGTLAGVLPLSTVLSPVLGLGAVILLMTGMTGFCGLYALLGVDTCPANPQ
ncbi:YgaP family membrane protein [Halorientalis regularis]|jgi:hypothetical protein|nr:DUF2892 domain-containing protein [Halorientalis regularis]